MASILRRNTDELDLHQLRVLDTLLNERNVTRGALVLNTTQPAISKTLMRLRRHFDDPLFVRVGLQMEPTPKALGMASGIRAILEGVQSLESAHAPFDAAVSDRCFNVLAVDAAVVVMLPPIVRALQVQAPHVHIRAMPLEAEHLHAWLQSGKADLAIGSFPTLEQGIRHQALFSASYLTLARRGHPRLGPKPTLAGFVSEKHVLMTAAGTGHAMQRAEEALDAAIPPEQITVRVSGSTAAALVAKQTDALVTLPSPLAVVLARELDLQIVKPPLRLPKFQVAQYWHERLHREAGNRWMRSTIASIFNEGFEAALTLPSARG
jgi:DNA-binding transcriptional LysR family regulator